MAGGARNRVLQYRSTGNWPVHKTFRSRHGPSWLCALHGRRYDTWFSQGLETPPSERYNYLYSEEELKRAQASAKGGQTGESTFVITNNHFAGKGIVNALQLIHLLTKQTVDAPPTVDRPLSRIAVHLHTTGITPSLFS